MNDFDWYQLRSEHRRIAGEVLGMYRAPDICLAPDGQAYLWRWHVIPRNSYGNFYLHVQVDDDPMRPPHDHPWDNTSVLLAGGYDERIRDETGVIDTFRRREGDVVHRPADLAHHLMLASPLGYTMTLFSTGPKRREWGFWFPDGWRSQREVIVNLPDGRSIFKDTSHATTSDR